MKRDVIVWMVAGILVVVVVAWVAQNTSWVDTTIPMPPKGEARTNPFYAAQRFAEALGARTVWDRELVVPPTDSVVVLSGWHWDLSRARRQALERWVESGGRLVVDRTLVGGEAEFERWSRIIRDYQEVSDKERAASDREGPCRKLLEHPGGTAPAGTVTTVYELCDFSVWSFLTTTRTVAWSLRGKSGIQALRVNVGRGSVTVVNAAPFRYRQLFDGDHGRLFVAATQLRRGDEVHFLSEDDHPSLLVLLWRYGGPLVVLAMSLVALLLWRGGVRLGPLAAPAPAGRRSLAEQIRGTGQFAERHGSGESLHAAVVRALNEAAQRHVAAYARLSPAERTAALARLTGVDAGVLTAAIHNPALRRAHQLQNTIALLETARRRIVVEHTRSSHGTY
jgi:hypothetical protein